MLETPLKKAFNQFDHNTEYQSYQELASKHINDTYSIKTTQKPYFVLQRINHGIFPSLIENKVKISEHIQQKLKHKSKKKQKRGVLAFANTKKDTVCYQDKKRNYWNLIYFIDKSITHEIITHEEIAYESGKLMGKFLTLTSDFDTAKLIETIPKFHNMSFRYHQFEGTLERASLERLKASEDYIEVVKASKVEMYILQKLKAAGKIKTRVTHNDTKISNVLFNKKKGLCITDTNTVMPKIIHYDFGDAIKTICNTAAGDETNLDLVKFNIDYYNAYNKGFLKHTKSFITPLELKYLSPLRSKNDDIYYGITLFNRLFKRRCLLQNKIS